MPNRNRDITIFVDGVQSEWAAENIVRTRTGYIGPDRTILASYVSGDDEGKPRYGFALIPERSLTILRSKRDAIDQPSANLTACMIQKLSMGQKCCAPAHEHAFVDRVTRTFFIPGNTLSLTSSYKDLLNLAAYLNFIHTKQWDQDFGMAENIYREARVALATIALDLLRGLEHAGEDGCREEDSNGYTPPPSRARGENVTARIHGGNLAVLRDAIRTDDDAMAFIMGSSALGCWRDHRPKNRKSGMNRLAKHMHAIGMPKDDILLPDEICSEKAITEMLGLGRRLETNPYIVKMGDDKTTRLPDDPNADGGILSFDWKRRIESETNMIETLDGGDGEDEAEDSPLPGFDIPRYDGNQVEDESEVSLDFVTIDGVLQPTDEDDYTDADAYEPEDY